MSSVSSVSSSVAQTLGATKKYASQSASRTASNAQNQAAARERAIQQVDAAVAENHGFDVRKATRDALANNTKIINSSPQERGQYIDISA